MQTTIKYQYEDPQSQRPIRYALSGTLQQKYNELPSMQAILRSTQTCPFTSIRQLIIAFKRNDPFNTDLPPCDLLRQKYQANPQYREISEQMARDLNGIQEARVRFQKLEACLGQYNLLFNEVRTQGVGAQDVMQGNQSKYQYDYRVYTRRNQMALDKESKYFEYLTFSQQFQRAIILASASQSQRFKPKQSLDRIDNFRLLSDKTSKIDKELARLETFYIEYSFHWREFVKHGRAKGNISEADRGRLRADWENLNGEIDGIYTQMSDFSAWLERDRREMRLVYENYKNMYRVFLPEFVKVKEAHEISSKNSFYYEVIREEKSRLEAHLRKNYGLIVPYAVSPEFTKAITPIQDPKNRQLKSLIEGEIAPFEDATLYINGQYQKLYKEACDSRDSTAVRKKIEQNIAKFNKYAEMKDQNNGFAYHLIESCQKLLRIAR